MVPVTLKELHVGGTLIYFAPSTYDLNKLKYDTNFKEPRLVLTVV